VPISGSEIWWALIAGTAALVMLGGVFIASIIFNQRRYITVQRQKLEAVQKSERHFRSLIENSFDAIALGKLDGTIVYASQSTQRVLGYSAEEIVSRSALDLFHPEDRNTLLQSLAQHPQTPGERVLAHFRARHKDGSWRWIEGVGVNLFSEPSVEAIIVNYRDITERKHSEEQLQSSHDQLRGLSAHLQSVREEERTQIAREIHDELGQMLTVLKMDLSLLQRKLEDARTNGTSVESKQEIQAMSSLIDSTIQSVRRIATELRPEILDELGLKDAIDWATETFQTRTGIKSKFRSSLNEVNLDRDRSTAVFRILQEALTNVARHANATEVITTLERIDHDIVLQIQDNGKGITEHESSGAKSLGLLGMRERSLIIGGTVDIIGETGKGTTVNVRIPI
jgi:two-component system, NarL family, sensor histidine kinase UhpB